MADRIPSPGPMDDLHITVRYFAAARAAAGVPEETVPVPSTRPAGVGRRAAQEASDHTPDAVATVDDVVAVITDRHGDDLARVLARCAFLLDEVAVHGRSTTLRDGQVLDVLPPFAGG